MALLGVELRLLD